MSTGFNACLGISPVNPCPLVEMAKAGLIDGFVPAATDETHGQIVVRSDRTVELDDWPKLTRTLRTDSHTYYRLTGFGFDPDGDRPCSSCEDCNVSECLLSTFSCLPVTPYDCFWRDGQLRLRFALGSRAELEGVVDALRDAGYTVDLKHLSRGDSQFDPSTNALVDLEVLTPRQREALALAVDGDYFGPDGADADELATELGVSTSTFSKHVRSGIRKVAEQAFGRG